MDKNIAILVALVGVIMTLKALTGGAAGFGGSRLAPESNATPSPAPAVTGAAAAAPTATPRQ